MKFLCDVHLPKRLITFFTKQSIEAIHGSEILDGWRTSDKDFCEYADKNDFIFIIKDNDFRNSHILKNTPLKLIKINLGNMSNDNLISIFSENLELLLHILKDKSVFVEINRNTISVFTKSEK